MWWQGMGLLQGKGAFCRDVSTRGYTPRWKELHPFGATDWIKLVWEKLKHVFMQIQVFELGLKDFKITLIEKKERKWDIHR